MQNPQKIENSQKTGRGAKHNSQTGKAKQSLQKRKAKPAGGARQSLQRNDQRNTANSQKTKKSSQQGMNCRKARHAGKRQKNKASWVKLTDHQNKTSGETKAQLAKKPTQN